MPDWTCVDLTTNTGLALASGFLVLRGAVFVIDRFEISKPWAKAFADRVGTVLGGAKQRGKE